MIVSLNGEHTQCKNVYHHPEDVGKAISNFPIPKEQIEELNRQIDKLYRKALQK